MSGYEDFENFVTEDVLKEWCSHRALSPPVIKDGLCTVTLARRSQDASLLQSVKAYGVLPYCSDKIMTSNQTRFQMKGIHEIKDDGSLCIWLKALFYEATWSEQHAYVTITEKADSDILAVRQMIVKLWYCFLRRESEKGIKFWLSIVNGTTPDQVVSEETIVRDGVSQSVITAVVRVENKNPRSSLENLGRRLFHICHRIGVSQGKTTFPETFDEKAIREWIEDANKYDKRLIYTLDSFDRDAASIKILVKKKTRDKNMYQALCSAFGLCKQRCGEYMDSVTTEDIGNWNEDKGKKAQIPSEPFRFDAEAHDYYAKDHDFCLPTDTKWKNCATGLANKNREEWEEECSFRLASNVDGGCFFQALCTFQGQDRVAGHGWGDTRFKAMSACREDVKKRSIGMEGGISKKRPSSSWTPINDPKRSKGL